MIHLDGYHLSPGLSPADSAALVAALDVDTWSRLDEGDPCRPPCPGRLELVTGDCSCYDSPPCSEHWLGCPVCGWEVPDSRPA